MTHQDFSSAAPHRRGPNRSSLLYFAIFLSVICGCGTGEYERRLENRLSKLRGAAKFNDLYGAQELPGTPVSVRVPQIFKDPPLIEGAQLNGKPVAMDRVRPKFVSLPGLKLTYELLVEDADGRKLPFYCYVGAIDTTNGKIKDPAAALRKELSTSAPKSLGEWEGFTAETPNGQAIPWRKLRCVGNQEFFSVDKGGQEQSVTVPGVLEVYLHEEGKYLVVVAWRTPVSIESKTELAKWAPLVAGCVSVKK
jgi:hypothetical protein